MANFFMNKRYIQDENAVLSADLVVAGHLINENTIELSITNQLSFKKETWTESSENYVPVEWVKNKGYMVVA